MGYYINLQNITLKEYRNHLVNAQLLKSRMPLKDNIDEYFTKLEKRGITNIAELQQALKTKTKLQDVSKQTGINGNYLKLLIREINSIQPKPNKLSDFPEVKPATMQLLNNAGIKTTVQLYEHVLTPGGRKALSEHTTISENDILFLTKLTDVSRIRWVGSTFAYVLVKAGFDSVEKIANAVPENLYRVITEMNQKETMFKGNIGLNDLKLTVASAQNLPVEIEY